MKKILLGLIGLLLVIPFVGNASVDISKYKYTDLYTTIQAEGGKPEGKYPVTDDGVDIYLIWGNGCPHCAHFIEFLKSYYKEFSHINLYAFETWKETSNQALMTTLEKEFGTEIEGVPFYIIGDKYYSGYASSLDKEIKEAIKAEYAKPVSSRSKKMYNSKAKKTSTKTIGTTETTTTTTVEPTTTSIVTNNVEQYNSNQKIDNNKQSSDDSIHNILIITIIIAIVIVVIVIIFMFVKGIK